MRSAAAAGFLVSSSVDMAKWLLFLLRKGQDENGNQVIEADELTRTFQTENIGVEVPFLQPDSSNIQLSLFDNYAMAWFLGYYRGIMTVDELCLLSIHVHIYIYYRNTCDQINNP